MTVKQLIDELKRYDSDTEVGIETSNEYFMHDIHQVYLEVDDDPDCSDCVVLYSKADE